ncbi:MAG: class II aldolase/adducin family protein, partial [Candidatus Omnitrophota bacterium]|nr:class II aldolase/adducin family protein [Candidatus Omnitrophota bacterium]
GSSGNISASLGKRKILITTTGAALGSLRSQDIIKVDFGNPQDLTNRRLTSEFPLHRLIHEGLANKVVIHCHPVLTNAYFAVSSKLAALTFESKLYLGDIPVIPQETPAVSKPEAVVEALKTSSLVILKNHGVVCIADNFKAAMNLIETLEDAVRTVAVARLFEKNILDNLDNVLKEDLASAAVYLMFSREHIQAIVDLVNHDEFIAQKGKELDLSVKLAIKLNDSNAVFKFNFEKGKIIKLDTDSDAPFIISAPALVWEQVFLGKLDSFVAVTQGKMKLEGQLGQLSKWYVPFSRLFELFKQVRIKT